MTATKPEAVAEVDLPSPRPETVAAADLPSSAESPRTSIKEGHYTIRAHPGDVYLGFAVPKSGTGENIATAVIDYLESVGVSTSSSPRASSP